MGPFNTPPNHCLTFEMKIVFIVDAKSAAIVQEQDTCTMGLTEKNFVNLDSK